MSNSLIDMDKIFNIQRKNNQAKFDKKWEKASIKDRMGILSKSLYKFGYKLECGDKNKIKINHNKKQVVVNEQLFTENGEQAFQLIENVKEYNIFTNEDLIK